MPRLPEFLSTPEAAAIAAGSIASVAVAVGLYRVYRRRRPTAAEMEARRRAALDSTGKMGDGMVVEFLGSSVVYNYAVRGVAYTASQDLSLLEQMLPLDPWSVVGPVGIKYDPRNPANSIVLCEHWSGLRKSGVPPATKTLKTI